MFRCKIKFLKRELLVHEEFIFIENFEEKKVEKGKNDEKLK